MEKINDIFGSLVFNDAVMRERLPKATYRALKESMETGTDLTVDVANVIAAEMKNWALEKGATHFAHWFQPLTGMTAEKHDAFISPNGDGTVIMDFSGKELIKGEPAPASLPEASAPLSRREDIPTGILLPTLLSKKRRSAFPRRSVLMRGRLWTKRRLFCVLWMPSISRGCGLQRFSA